MTRGNIESCNYSHFRKQGTFENSAMLFCDLKVESNFGSDPTNKKIVISIRNLTCYKDGNGGEHPGKFIHLKCHRWLEINKHMSKIWISKTHLKASLGDSNFQGVRLWMLRPEMWLVPVHLANSGRIQHSWWKYPDSLSLFSQNVDTVSSAKPLTGDF